MDLNIVKTLTDYIEELGQLTENWDGYGAIPIYPRIIEKAQWFLSAIPDKYLHLTNVGKIAPNTNGTLTIDFEDNNNSILSISFGLEYENFYHDIDDVPIDESEVIDMNPDTGIPQRIIDSLENLQNKKQMVAA